MKIQASGQDAGAVARHAAIGIDRFFNSPSEAGLTSSPPSVAHALAPIGPQLPSPPAKPAPAAFLESWPGLRSRVFIENGLLVGLWVRLGNLKIH
jgi:hypothetical protein